MTSIFCEGGTASAVVRGFSVVLLSCSLWAQTSSPERRFQEAVAAQEHGDNAAALKIYQQLYLAYPKVEAVRVNIAATLVALGRYDEAIVLYRAMLTTEPGKRKIRLDLAFAYQRKGDLQRAVEELEPLNKIDPSDGQAAMLLGDCYSQLERPRDAVLVLMPIEASKPDDLDLSWLLGSALVRSGRPQEGLLRIDKVAERGSSADAYLLAGGVRLSLTQYDVARRDADAAMRLNPDLAGVQTLMGMILEQTGDYAGAEAALRKAIQADNKDYNAHFYLGAILYFNRSLKGARENLEIALQLQPNSVAALYKLALLDQTEGHENAALRELERVTRASPNWLEPHVKLAAMYYSLHRPEDGARERQIVDRLVAAQAGAPPATSP